MIVAAGTLQPHAEEQAGRRLAAGRAGRDWPGRNWPADSRTCCRGPATSSRTNWSSGLPAAIQSRIQRVEGIDPLGVEHLLFVPQQVGPFQGPVLGELGPREQARRSAASRLSGDGSATNARASSAVGKRPIASRYARRMNVASSAQRRGIHLQRAQLGEDQLVDVVRRPAARCQAKPGRAGRNASRTGKLLIQRTGR